MRISCSCILHLKSPGYLFSERLRLRNIANKCIYNSYQKTADKEVLYNCVKVLRCHRHSALRRYVPHHMARHKITRNRRGSMLEVPNQHLHTKRETSTHKAGVLSTPFCGNLLHCGQSLFFKLFLSISGRKENQRKTIRTKRLKRNR